MFPFYCPPRAFPIGLSRPGTDVAHGRLEANARIPVIAQLVEHLTVDLRRHQMVPGSIPGDRILLCTRARHPFASKRAGWNVGLQIPLGRLGGFGRVIAYLVFLSGENGAR